MSRAKFGSLAENSLSPTHYARRSGSQHTGKLALRVGDGVRIGRVLIGEVPSAVALETRQCGVRTRFADEAPEELPEVAVGGAPAPDTPALRCLLEDVDELHCLAALDHRL